MVRQSLDLDLPSLLLKLSPAPHLNQSRAGERDLETILDASISATILQAVGVLVVGSKKAARAAEKVGGSAL